MECLIVIATSSACKNELDSIRTALKDTPVSVLEVEWLSQEDFFAQVGCPRQEK